MLFFFWWGTPSPKTPMGTRMSLSMPNLEAHSECKAFRSGWLNWAKECTSLLSFLTMWWISS
eukprot:6131128-Alexandrium_andersonii.AAC.1